MRGIGSIIIILIVLGGAWYLLSGKTPQNPTVNITEQTGTTTGATGTTPAGGVGTLATSTTVTYTDQGFSPATVTIAQGGKVTFVNQSSTRMWVASDPHPSHTTYSGTTRAAHCPDTTGTAFDECAAVEKGGTYTFTFSKFGTWGYHNHARDGDGGTVIVAAD